jgi:hypothetical protein
VVPSLSLISQCSSMELSNSAMMMTSRPPNRFARLGVPISGFCPQGPLVFRSVARCRDNLVARLAIVARLFLDAFRNLRKMSRGIFGGRMEHMKIEKACCLEYTDIPRELCTKYYIGHCCINVIPVHYCVECYSCTNVV